MRGGACRAIGNGRINRSNYEEFDTRPTRAKKLAWGTAPYMGTDRTSDDMGEPMAGYPVVSYSVWITFNKSAGTKTRNLATSIRSE